MTFHPNVLLIFDRSGTRIGSIDAGPSDAPRWTVTAPRTYRISEVEDFSFRIPLRDSTGAVVFDSAMAALIVEDNLIYIEDELTGLPGWGGSISDISFSGGVVDVKCLGGLGLLDHLDSGAIRQSGGTSDSIAASFIAAAAAKESAYGDTVLRLVVDGTTNNYGVWTYEGDCLQGLLQAASDLLAEVWCESLLGSLAESLSFRIHWDARVAIDKTTILMQDGPGGAIELGSQISFSSLEPVNRLRIVGQTTNFGQFLDYPAVASVLTDITPEVEFIDPAAKPNLRRREALTLTVNIGYSDDVQRAIARSVQTTYLGYFKSFLYAYHNVLGKPFLEGFDWSGMDGVVDVKLTARRYHTYQRLGVGTAGAVVLSGTDGPGTSVVIDQWSLDSIITPVTAAVGIALDFQTLTGHWVADGSTGHLWILEADNITLTDWGSVSGGTLVGVATDVGNPGSVYVLLNSGGNSVVKEYDVGSMALLSNWAIAGTFNDLAVDFADGKIYLVGSGSNIEIRDLASGTLISPDPSYPAGLSPTGISVTGGVAYVVDSGGHLRMLFDPGGSLAGTFDTGVTGAAGLFADWRNRKVYVIQGDGGIAIYDAYVAVGTVPVAGTVDGAPGFDTILGGQFVHIVMSNDLALSSKSTPKATGTYTVVHGDTLWGISIRFYGHGSSWPTIYAANKAVIGANPSLIIPGQVLRIPGGGGATTPPAPANKGATSYFMCYTPGSWVSMPVPGPVGQPDFLQKTWVQTAGIHAQTGGDQTVGFIGANELTLVDPQCVIQGEEGRVGDWDPTTQGYGVYKNDQLYRTANGYVVSGGPGWYPADWDVPAAAFEAIPPPWPEGLQYALDWLRKNNGTITTQTIKVINLDNLWNEMRLGAIFSVLLSRQGVPGVGISGNFRVTSFAPDEAAGDLEISGEFYQ